MRYSLVILACSIVINAVAQSTANNSIWTKDATFSLALAQGGTRNWAPGGDRFTFAVNGFVTLNANKTKLRRHWDNKLEANFGLMNSDVAGVIKNDDKLDINSRWSYELSNKPGKWRLGIHTNLRTQFADGYDYDAAVRKRISAFMAPGVFVFSPGVEWYGSDKKFNLHFSPITPRWVLVANRPYELAANYGVQPNEKVRNEAGSFASINYKKEIVKNISYKSRLDLFSNYLDKAQNIDVFWTNIFHLKINNVIGAVYNFDLQYDDNTTIFGYGKNRPGTQLKSIFGLGLSCKFQP